MKKRKLVYLFPITAMLLSGCSFAEIKHSIGESWVGEHLLHPIYDPIRDLVSGNSGSNQKKEDTAVSIKMLIGFPKQIQQNAELSLTNLKAIVAYSDNSEKTEPVTKVELDTSKTGEVTGKAYVGTLSKEFKISVYAGEMVDVTGIRYTLEPQKYAIEVNEKIQLAIEVEPEDATNKNVIYEFSTEGIVSIENGFIKGLKAGKTDITIKSVSNPEVKKTISGFTVKKADAAVPAETAAGLKLFTEGALKNGETINIAAIYGDSIFGMGPLGGNYVTPVDLSVDENGKLVVGETLNYKALLNNDGTYSLKDSNDKFLSLASSGNSVAIKEVIDDDCKFYIGHGENGTTTVVGANSAVTSRFLVYNASNPRFSFYKESTAATYPQLIVYHDGQEAEKKAVTGVEFLKESYEVEVGKSVNVAAAVLPKDATDQEVTYSLKDVSPEGCATISGNVVTGVAEGTATVVATSHDGNFTAEASVTVVPKKTVQHAGTLADPYTAEDACVVAADLSDGSNTSEYFYIKGVVSSLVEAFNPDYGNYTFMLDEVFEAYRMKNGPEFASFTSEDDIKVGDTIILYAQIKNYKGTYETGGGYVYAVNPTTATGVSLSQTELSLEVGSAPVTLVATVAPEDAVNKAVTWESSNLEVATVSNGVVTAVGEGSATITVKTVDGDFSATCVVTITPATKHLTGITAVGPTKTTYTQGETLDLTGLVVTAHYDDGSSEVIEAGYTTNIALDKELEATDTSLVISYNGKSADSISLTINSFEDGCHEAVLVAASLEPGQTSTKTVKVSGRIMFKPGNNLIIQDGSHAVIVYKNAQSTKDMEIGKKVSMECKIQNYNGAAETEKLANDAITISNDQVSFIKGSVTSSEAIESFPQSNIADFDNLIIKTKPSLVSGSDGSFKVSFKENTEKEYTFFMKKSLYSASLAAMLNSMDVGAEFSVTNAYVSVYNGAKQICSGTESVVTDKTVYTASAITITKDDEEVTVLNMGAGETAQLNASVTPAKASQEVEWSVEPAGVVTVENGLVTVVAEADGSAIVTATAKGTDVSSSVTVNVSLVHEITSIEISGSMKTEYSTNDTGYDVSGLTVTAIYNNDPSDTEDVTDDVEWSFDKTFPAGVVTSSLEVKATATLKGTALTDDITETISVVKTKEYISVPVTMKGFAGLSAGSYTNNNTEMTDDIMGMKFGSYAFNPSTGQIRGGKTYIADTTASGDNAKNWHFYNVTELTSKIESISVTIDKSDSNYFKGSLYLVYGNESVKDVTDLSKVENKLVWTAEENTKPNEIVFDTSAISFKYFKICSNVAFTAGSVTNATVNLSIEKPEGEVPVTSITLNETAKTLAPNDTLQLEATVLPDFADNKAVEWTTTENDGVISVDQTGKVTALKEGTANVVATAKDGSGVTAECKITVASKPVGNVTASYTIDELIASGNIDSSVKNASFELDDVVTVSTKGTGDSGKIFGSSPKDWRIYHTDGGDITITVSEGYELVSVSIKYKSNKGGYLVDSSGARIESEDVVEASGSSITFTALGGESDTKVNGQAQVQAITVIYKAL